MNFKLFSEFDQIREYGLFVVFFKRSYLKYHSTIKDDYKKSALGIVRVMRTTGMKGEVIGMAASVAAKNKTNPSRVYTNHQTQQSIP